MSLHTARQHSFKVVATAPVLQTSTLLAPIAEPELEVAWGFFKHRLNAARNQSAASSSCLNPRKNSTAVSSYCGN